MELATLMSIANVNRIVFVNLLAASQFCIFRLTFFYPMMEGAPVPKRIALSDSQSAILWMFVTNSRGCMTEEGRNQPIERPSKIGN